MDEPSDGLFTTPEMAAAFSTAAPVLGMLAFEAALARAQARAGDIPPEAADAIAAACHVELFDAPAVLTAMAQEHEQAIGGWQAEWAAIPELFRYTAGAVARISAAVGGLTIDAGRMRENLERDGGLLMSESLAMALVAHVGRPQAQRIVQDGGRRAEGLTLSRAAHADARVRASLAPEDVTALIWAAVTGKIDVREEMA